MEMYRGVQGVLGSPLYPCLHHVLKSDNLVYFYTVILFNRKMKYLALISIFSLFYSCSNPEKKHHEIPVTETAPDEKPKDTHFAGESNDSTIIHDTVFVDLKTISNEIAYDFRYADTTNFLHARVYPCVQCLLRKEVAHALDTANKQFLAKGYRLRLFDCYRPRKVQIQMWDLVPDARYVANPYTTGSIHNRGGAVDLTIETIKGEMLDMGTDFDHFGIEAHSNYKNLPDTIIHNRELLRATMVNAGFKGLDTEWWHFNYKNADSYSISEFSFDCDY